MPNIVFAFDKQSARSIDADGRMRVRDCILSTSEINPYRGQEIPGYDKLGLQPNAVYELYRDADEMRKSAATFEGVPLMIKHIAQTADDPRKEYQAGAIHSVTFDGKHLRGDLLVSDGRAIDLIEADELSDLSAGYRYDADMTPGEYDGQKYDGVMRNIQGNHIALVDDGRATGAHVADHALRVTNPDTSITGDSTMPLPNENAEHEAAPGANAAPGSPAGEMNEQNNMAAIGQSLKHIAALLENIHGRLPGMPAGQDNMAAGAPGEGGEMSQDPDPEAGGNREGASGEGAEDTAGADHEREGMDHEHAEDFNLELGARGAGEARGEREGAEDGDLDVGQGESRLPEQAAQEGTTARGGPTPFGAMDSKTRAIVNREVDRAIKAERARGRALEEARRETRGVLGDAYGLDSAGDVYRAALEQMGINPKAIARGQERTAWQAAKVATMRQAGVRPQAEMAMDAAATDKTRSSIAAKLARISVKG